MSRLEVPLLYRTLKATGDILLRAELDLLLKNSRGLWKPESFLVDSGTEMTTMPAWLAKQLDLPMPRTATKGVTHQQTGLSIRAGVLRGQIAGMDGTEYVFPCLFLGDPDSLPLWSSPARMPRKLLGLSGVVDKIRLTMDGKAASMAPYGNLIVEKQ